MPLEEYTTEQAILICMKARQNFVVFEPQHISGNPKLYNDCFYKLRKLIFHIYRTTTTQKQIQSFQRSKILKLEASGLFETGQNFEILFDAVNFCTCVLLI